MNYSELLGIFSDARFNRYHLAVANNDDKAVDLYHFNIILSQQMFGLISVFEIILRNKINAIMIKETKDPDWLLHSIQHKTTSSFNYQGCFLKYETQQSANLISVALFSLGQDGYQADKLLAELGLGFWRYLFAGGKNAQFESTGKILMDVFPKRPRSFILKDTNGNDILDKKGNPKWFHYNQKWVFDELSKINKFRNRLAHHEPICFDKNGMKSTQYVLNTYQNILNLMNYMDIDTNKLFSKLHLITDSIIPMSNQIDAL